MASTKCKYCGSSAYGGTGDSRHPKGSGRDGRRVHVHTHDGAHCIYCGTTALGRTGGSNHPDGVHER